MVFKTKFERGCLLIIGGAKSGKSRFALDVCNRLSGKHIFLATAEAQDQEMKARIRRHQAERGGKWLTVEEPFDVVSVIRDLDDKDTVILLDCLALWLNNLFMKFGENQDAIEQALDEQQTQLSSVQGAVVVVSNEVGMGIVPDNQLSRRYRDTLGSMNQEIARLAAKVVVTLAGMPLVIKDR
jgi:adenosylcobinamide kinase/adenosylcobinamide-phosphate guanylyltransferase